MTEVKKILMNVLPVGVRGPIKAVAEWVDHLLMKICASSRFLASVYYCFFSRQFAREHLAVLNGRLAYKKALRNIGYSSPKLRRNIHRLEKGLIMKPRRAVFGESFIVETVRCFNQACVSENYSGEELKWAGDVLEEYFSVVHSSPIIDKARKEYKRHEVQALKEQESENSHDFKPYPRASSPRCTISIDELISLFTRRRSVRWYNDTPVPDEKIKKCINAAALAPSACNRQPFRFVVANNPGEASKIAACAGGTVGFAHQLSAILVAVGDLSAYPTERDRHLIYIDASLASMQLMLAAETLGLSTCPINWPDVDESEKRLQRILHLPRHERVVMLIAIGYGEPDSGIPYSQKKTEDLLYRNLGSQ